MGKENNVDWDGVSTNAQLAEAGRIVDEANQARIDAGELPLGFDESEDERVRRVLSGGK